MSESAAEPAPPAPPVQEKHAPGIGMPASLYLHDFGEILYDAFGEVAYQVGSSLVASGRPNWRDVDVRLILDDERYAAEGYGNPENPHDNAKWVAMVKAFSLLGRQMTGLPIDFQIQQRTHANTLYGRATGCDRSAVLGVRWAERSDAFNRGRASAKGDSDP